jgi:PBSX family phage portal protein
VAMSESEEEEKQSVEETEIDSDSRMMISISGGDLARKALEGESVVAPMSNLLDVNSRWATAYGRSAYILPSYDPSLLVRWWQLSNCLRQYTDVIRTNVVHGGWRLERTIDFDSDDGVEIVRASIVLERERESAKNGKRVVVPQPSDEEVNQRIEDLREKQWRQRVVAKAFLRNCGGKRDLIDVLDDVVVDRESVGWGVLEVRRNASNVPKRIGTDKAYTFRAMPSDDPIEIDVKEYETEILRTVDRDWVRFRRYIQMSPYTGHIRYFKEYGDPRVVSMESGKIFDSEENLYLVEGGRERTRPANELIWLSHPNPEIGVYGLTRWSGQINSVVGSYKMELVNVLYFRDKAIPPLAVLVSGGSLGKKVKANIEREIREHIKGTENFHGVLFIEAEGKGPSFTNQAGSGNVRVEFKPLTDAFFKDQIFGEYDSNNIKKIRQSFRIPTLLVGDTEKDNRATVDAALRFFDAQVAAPERGYFERSINRLLLADIGVYLWKWRLRAPLQINPEEMIQGIAKLVDSTVTPREGRELLNQWFDYELDRIDAEWVNMPLRQWLAEVSARASGRNGDGVNLGEIDMNRNLLEALSAGGM